MIPLKDRTANLLDGLAIGGSALCMLHCLALPLMAAFSPALSSWLQLGEAFHFWFLVLAFPFSTLVLWQHSLRQGRLGPFVLGMAGLAIMASALMLEQGLLEPLVTTFGGILLAFAHVLNYRGRAACES